MALPTHRLSVFKKYLEERWSNDWLLNVASMAEGITVTDAIVNFERYLHSSSVTFEYYLLSTMTEGDRVFKHQALNLTGNGAVIANDALPLFNTVRLDLSTMNSDPCRKYFRMPVVESHIENGKFTPAALTAWNGIVVTHLSNSVALDNIVSGKGNVITGGTINPYVQMRQLHRRKRPKITA